MGNDITCRDGEPMGWAERDHPPRYYIDGVPVWFPRRIPRKNLRGVGPWRYDVEPDPVFPNPAEPIRR